MSTVKQRTAPERNQQGEPKRENSRNIEDLEGVCNEVGSIVLTYARQRPEITAIVCVGIGFVLGWKLKPW